MFVGRHEHEKVVDRQAVEKLVFEIVMRAIQPHAAAGHTDRNASPAADPACRPGFGMFQAAMGPQGMIDFEMPFYFVWR
jgi:hypothetical protein